MVCGILAVSASIAQADTIVKSDALAARQYYPKAAPTLWYALPGDRLGFRGVGFAPGETIWITDSARTSLSARADGNGNFNMPSAVLVPFDWQGAHTFTIRGTISKWPIVSAIVVGTFYPQIAPSSYWIGVGQSMSVSGVSFAPGERVQMFVNESQVARTTADGIGNVNFNITAPGSGASATLTARGLSSGLSSTRVIYLHR